MGLLIVDNGDAPVRYASADPHTSRPRSFTMGLIVDNLDAPAVSSKKQGEPKTASPYLGLRRPAAPTVQRT